MQCSVEHSVTNVQTNAVYVGHSVTKWGGRGGSIVPLVPAFSCHSSAWSTSHHAHPLDHHIKHYFHHDYRNYKKERNKSYKNVWITIYCSFQVCPVKLYKSKVERQVFSDNIFTLNGCCLFVILFEILSYVVFTWSSASVGLSLRVG